MAPDLAAQLTAAIMAAVEEHHENIHGVTQWYVDEMVIDCDAAEFWKVVERVLANAPTTAAEFEERYAADSGTTVAELHRLGRYAEPCPCGAALCTGWQMGRQHEDALAENAAR